VSSLSPFHHLFPERELFYLRGYSDPFLECVSLFRFYPRLFQTYFPCPFSSSFPYRAARFFCSLRCFSEAFFSCVRRRKRGFPPLGRRKSFLYPPPLFGIHESPSRLPIFGTPSRVAYDRDLFLLSKIFSPPPQHSPPASCPSASKLPLLRFSSGDGRCGNDAVSVLSFSSAVEYTSFFSFLTSLFSRRYENPSLC